MEDRRPGTSAGSERWEPRHCRWAWKRAATLKNRWFSKKLDVKVASNPAIPPLGTHPRETETWVHTKTCTSVFTEPRAPDRLCQARGCHHPTQRTEPQVCTGPSRGRQEGGPGCRDALPDGDDSSRVRSSPEPSRKTHLNPACITHSRLLTPPPQGWEPGQGSHLCADARLGQDRSRTVKSKFSLGGRGQDPRPGSKELQHHKPSLSGIFFLFIKRI